MARTTIKGDQIRDGEVKTADLSGEAITEDKLADAAASALKFQNLAVTDPKLALRTISTTKLADDYVLDGDVVDIGGTTLFTTSTLAAETSYVSVSVSESAPTLDTDGIALDGASHVCWAFSETVLLSATYQGWLYTTALGWIQIPTLSGVLANGDAISDTLEVSGAERLALPVSALTGTGPVTWTADVNVSILNNNLTKSTVSVGWDAGAVSEQVITENGFMEFTTAEIGTSKMAGLGNGDTDQNYTDIDFAIYLSNSTPWVKIFEGGTQKPDSGTNFGSYAPGDVFRVEVVNGVVTYRKNGTLFYTSLGTPTLPLLTDTSLFNAGTTINEVVMNTVPDLSVLRVLKAVTT